jgi:hypothetical protein
MGERLDRSRRCPEEEGLRGSGHGWSLAEIQHSRLSTTRFASRAAATTSSAINEEGGADARAAAAPRPSIVSPASATVSRDRGASTFCPTVIGSPSRAAVTSGPRSQRASRPRDLELR